MWFMVLLALFLGYILGVIQQRPPGPPAVPGGGQKECPSPYVFGQQPMPTTNTEAIMRLEQAYGDDE